MKIIFFNIGYMKYYKGINEFDKIESGHGYIVENNDGAEKYNFTEIHGKYFGFVEPGHGKGGYKEGSKQNRIHIEKVIGVRTPVEYVEDVLVVWCANLPNRGGTSVIGWYKDAKIYDRVQQFECGVLEGGKKYYNSEAHVGDCVLLPENERYKEKWKVPRTNTDGIGFGQASTWYAKVVEKEKQGKIDEYIRRLLNNINGYK